MDWAPARRPAPVASGQAGRMAAFTFASVGRSHHRHPMLLGHVGHGVGDRRVVRSKNQIDLVLRDELFIETDGPGGVRPVVVDHQLEPPPQHSALVVRVLDAELVTAKLALADRRKRAGLGERRADPDRRLPPRPRRPETTGA